MSDKITIINLSASDTSNRMLKRATDIQKECNLNTFELDRLSNGWPEEMKQQLLRLVKSIRDEPFSFANAFTDVTTLKKFLFKQVPNEPRSNRVPSDNEIKDWLTPNLGHCAISSLPRIDLGSPNQEVFRDHLIRLGYGASDKDQKFARYERLSAFGVTYASLFVKQIGKQFDVDSDGKRRYVGPSRLIVAVLGNNNLDKFVGPFDAKSQSRKYTNVPEEWMMEQQKKVRDYVEKVKDRRRKGGGARLPPKERPKPKKKVKSKPVVKQDSDLPVSLMDWKNSQLRQRLMDLGLPYSGTKQEMADRLIKHGYGTGQE